MRKAVIILIVLIGVFLAIGCASNTGNNTQRPSAPTANGGEASTGRPTPVYDLTPDQETSDQGVTPVQAVTPAKQVETVTEVVRRTPITAVTPATSLTGPQA